MNYTEIAKVLSSKTRMRILQIVAQESVSAIDVFKRYNTKFSDSKHRESIYRDLELLFSAKLLNKKYNEGKKQIVYVLMYKHITLNIVSGEVTLSK